MNSKFLLILILFVLSSCSLNTINKNETSEIIALSGFKNNGFTLSEPDVLLDSGYIIERSGEKFRSSINMERIIFR